MLGSCSFRPLLNSVTNLRNGLTLSKVQGLHKIPKSHLQQQQQKQQSNGPKTPIGLYNKVRDSILLFEASQGPFGKAVVGIGQGLAAGTLVFGTGASIYYGVFHKPAIEAIRSDPEDYLKPQRSSVPDYVKDRVNTTYMYFSNSLVASTLGAVASFRIFSNMAFLNAIVANPLLAVGLTMASQFIITMTVRRLPYEEGFGVKQFGSIVQGVFIGLTAAPMYLLGAQSVIRAGFVTAGVIGGLTGLSAIVPHDSFVKWETPLRIGMHTVFLAFMSLWFVPAHLPVYNILYRVAMQGGLIIFPAFYLFNSKAVVQSAMFSPHFDPINASMSMYMDALNIYFRLAVLLPPYYFVSGDARNITWAAQSSNKSK